MAVTGDDAVAPGRGAAYEVRRGVGATAAILTVWLVAMGAFVSRSGPLPPSLLAVAVGLPGTLLAAMLIWRPRWSLRVDDERISYWGPRRRWTLAIGETVRVRIDEGDADGYGEAVFVASDGTEHRVWGAVVPMTHRLVAALEARGVAVERF